MAKNTTIRVLEEWASDPVALERFESVALLCQRTALVKQILGLTQSDEFVRDCIRRVCDRHGVQNKLPRGSGLGAASWKDLSSEQRYMASVALKLMLASADSGLERIGDAVDSVALVDRMVYSYRRYLNVARMTAGQAPVSFELMYVIYKAYQTADIELDHCSNCGADYISVQEGPKLKCPLCQLHRHAAPSRSITERAQEDETGRERRFA